MYTPKDPEKDEQFTKISKQSCIEIKLNISETKITSKS